MSIARAASSVYRASLPSSNVLARLACPASVSVPPSIAREQPRVYEDTAVVAERRAQEAASVSRCWPASTSASSHAALAAASRAGARPAPASSASAAQAPLIRRSAGSPAPGAVPAGRGAGHAGRRGDRPDLLGEFRAPGPRRPRRSAARPLRPASPPRAGPSASWTATSSCGGRTPSWPSATPRPARRGQLLRQRDRPRRACRHPVREALRRRWSGPPRRGAARPGAHTDVLVHGGPDQRVRATRSRAAPSGRPPASSRCPMASCSAGSGSSRPASAAASARSQSAPSTAAATTVGIPRPRCTPSAGTRPARAATVAPARPRPVRAASGRAGRGAAP